MSKIKSLIQQAELYRKQGLLNEANEKYQTVKNLVEKSNAPNKDTILAAITKKMGALRQDFDTVTNAPQTPEMSAHVNELIKKLFAFSKDEEDKDTAALEGAIALAKFGQFESALLEFEKLISVDSLKVPAAKNILRCHLTLSSDDKAIDLFNEWQSSELFKPEQMEKIRLFLEDLLAKKGINKELAASPVASQSTAAAPVDEDDEEDEQFLDISAVAITLDSGPHKGEQIELDVSFQQGNIISLIISSRDEELIENLQVGSRLEDVHFYSPIAIFRGAGVVESMTKITSGPKEGDFSLDIKIESI